MHAKNKTRPGRAAGILIGLLVVVALIAAAAEIGARAWVSHQIDEGFRQAMAEESVTAPEDPETSFGAAPLLPGLLSRSIGRAEIRAPRTLLIEDPLGERGAPVVRGTPAARVLLTDLDVSDAADPVAGGVEITASVPADLILAEANLATRPAGDSLLERMAADLTRMTKVTPDPARGVLVCEFGGGLASADVTPVARGGAVEAEVSGGALAGIDADAVIAALADAAVSGPVAQIGGGLTVTGIRVVPGGLEVDLAGSGVRLSELRGIDYATR
ncbi:hypothetical protein CSPHI_01070 [Corynebacterium sphenisci DSM 44792]|uniref:DUF2993 domain-containing protein n=1 Tax=Corynebacterium sphenisci DSM 44792 TaxID=1437874 RepID=A0A1L7CVM0_9CORY|nr:LmeA family phospholipid-binding protein [Corynebacterium sphenisci]APT89909.1 hypothetical protein CSPHI_01070 [Corynebacterium sphenisci DSM 44792]